MQKASSPPVSDCSMEDCVESLSFHVTTRSALVEGSVEVRRARVLRNGPVDLLALRGVLLRWKNRVCRACTRVCASVFFHVGHDVLGRFLKESARSMRACACVFVTCILLESGVLCSSV